MNILQTKKINDMGWISVKDKLPKTKSQILTVDMDSGIKNWYSPYVMTYWATNDQPNFTHWMPLPKPPK